MCPIEIHVERFLEELLYTKPSAGMTEDVFAVNVIHRAQPLP